MTTLADITIETPLSDDMRVLIAELNDVLSPLTPEEFSFRMSPEEMNGEATSVFVARVNGEAVACGALHRHADGIGEVKRMYTRPASQKKGLGGQVLTRIIAQATQEGFRQLVLETGTQHAAAWRTYERAGFTRCGPVLDYPDSPHCIFYSLPLVAETEI
jgi:putative acetyltransferase